MATIAASEATALDKLQHREQAELLDVIERLRSAGIQEYIPLPQVIVVGDQSSGKSSVLEAISSHPFPTKDSLCTTFATELVLRRAHTYCLKVSIIPGRSRDIDNATRLRAFSKVSSSNDDLAAFLEEARNEIENSSNSGPRSFKDDILRIEQSGPSCQQPLTLVDLPGLIHAETRHQNKNDVDLVRELATKYMALKESIILAVVAADNNHSNQVVLKLAREHDPVGKRTLGVITKPDRLGGDPDAEKEIMALARNEEVHFELGWHILKNRGYATRNSSMEERDNAEEELLSSAPWSELPRNSRGIQELRQRVSNILYKKCASGLGDVLGNIQTLLKTTDESLACLGNARPTKREKLTFLIDVAEKFRSLIEAALRGDYSDPFFCDTDEDRQRKKRLCATVKALNKQFARNMIENGHTWGGLLEHNDEPNEQINIEERLQRRTYFAPHVAELQKRNAGPELPGIPNSQTICDFFREQSKNWKDIALHHIHEVWSTVMSFMSFPLEQTDSYTSCRVLNLVLEPAMESRLEILKAKLEELYRPYGEGLPATFNEQFERRMTLYRWRRGQIEEEDEEEPQQPAQAHSKHRRQDSGSYSMTSNLVQTCEGKNQDTLVDEICDLTATYYTIARDTFIDNVAILAVQQTLLRDINNIFSARALVNISEHTIELIASEAEEIQQRRKELEQKRNVLMEGRLICQRHYNRRMEIRGPISRNTLPTSSLTTPSTAQTAARNAMDPQPSTSLSNPRSSSSNAHREETHTPSAFVVSSENAGSDEEMQINQSSTPDISSPRPSSIFTTPSQASMSSTPLTTQSGASRGQRRQVQRKSRAIGEVTGSPKPNQEQFRFRMVGNPHVSFAAYSDDENDEL